MLSRQRATLAISSTSATSMIVLAWACLHNVLKIPTPQESQNYTWRALFLCHPRYAQVLYTDETSFFMHSILNGDGLKTCKEKIEDLASIVFSTVGIFSSMRIVFRSLKSTDTSLEQGLDPKASLSAIIILIWKIQRHEDMALFMLPVSVPLTLSFGWAWHQSKRNAKKCPCQSLNC